MKQKALIGLLLLPVTFLSGCSGRGALDAMKKAASAAPLIDIRNWAFFQIDPAWISFWWKNPKIMGTNIGWIPGILILGCLLAIYWKVAFGEKGEKVGKFYGFIILTAFPDEFLLKIYEIGRSLWPTSFSYAWLVQLLGWAFVEKALSLDVPGLLESATTFAPSFIVLQLAVISHRVYGGVLLESFRWAVVFAILIRNPKVLLPWVVAVFTWWIWPMAEYGLLKMTVDGIFAGSGVAFIIVTGVMMIIEWGAPFVALIFVAREIWEDFREGGWDSRLQSLVDLVQTVILLKLGREPREQGAGLPVPVERGDSGWHIYHPTRGEPGADGGELPPLATTEPYIEEKKRLALPPPRGEAGGDVIHLGPKGGGGSGGEGGPSGAGGPGGGLRGTPSGGSTTARDTGRGGNLPPHATTKGVFGATVGGVVAVASGLPLLAGPASGAGRAAAEAPSLLDLVWEVAGSPAEALETDGGPLPPHAGQEPIVAEPEGELDIITDRPWWESRTFTTYRARVDVRIDGRTIYSQGERFLGPYQVTGEGLVLDKYRVTVPWNDVVIVEGGG